MPLVTRITGGLAIGPNGRIPYMLALAINDYVKCGAILVDVYNVHIALTATHCVWKGWPESNTIRKPSELTVFAGKRKISKWDETREQYRNVTKVVVHDYFDRSSLDHDVTILFLSGKFTDSKWVYPLSLPGHDWDLPKVVRVSGWGAKKLWALPEDELRYIDLPVPDQQRCKRFDNQFGDTITDYEFCAGYIAGGHKELIGICRGDSGGPAAAYNASFDGWYAAGIVSFNTGKMFRTLGLNENYVGIGK